MQAKNNDLNSGNRKKENLMTFSETDLGINSMRGCEGKGRINDQKVTLLFQFFNCWKIALQCCIGFRCITKQNDHIIYVASLS